MNYQRSIEAKCRNCIRKRDMDMVLTDRTTTRRGDRYGTLETYDLICPVCRRIGNKHQVWTPAPQERLPGF